MDNLTDRLPLSSSGDAETERDPHTWDDPSKPALTERVTPSSPKGTATAGIAVTLMLGLAAYTFRLIPVIPLVTGAAAISAVFASYWRGQQAGLRRIRQIDWSILVDGDTASVRFGDSESAADSEVTGGLDDGGWTFKPGRSVNATGVTDYMTLSDVFKSPNDVRAKMHRDGDDPARDYLPSQFTATARTETLGTVHITLTDGLEREAMSPDVDRVATHPSVIPDAMVGDIKSGYQELSKIHLPETQRRLEMQRRRADDLARPVQDQIRERLDIALDIIESADVSKEEAARRAAEPDPMPRNTGTDAVNNFDSDLERQNNE